MIYIEAREAAIPVFTGDGRVQFADWKEELQRAWRLPQYQTPAERLYHLHQSIGRGVANFLRLLSSTDQQDPEACLAALVEQFGERRQTQELLCALVSIRQEPTETLLTFALRLTAAFEALTQRQTVLGEPETSSTLPRDIFINWVVCPELRRALRVHRHVQPQLTLLQACEYAQCWAEEERQPSLSYRHIPSTVSLADRQASLETELEMLRQQLAMVVASISTVTPTPVATVQEVERPVEKKRRRRRHRKRKGKWPQKPSKAKFIRRLRGQVKFFFRKKGWGFVQLEDGGQAFLHWTGLAEADADGFRTVEEGDEVMCRVIRTGRGFAAIEVTRVSHDRPEARESDGEERTEESEGNEQFEGSDGEGQTEESEGEEQIEESEGEEQTGANDRQEQTKESDTEKLVGKVMTVIDLGSRRLRYY